MRHIPLCLVVPFVLACGPEFGPNHFTIRVRGTVTAADDGSPVEGAVLEVWGIVLVELTRLAQDMTDASGDYSLSFVVDPCPAMRLDATRQGFLDEYDDGGVFPRARLVGCKELVRASLMARPALCNRSPNPSVPT